ncbi:UNVERIFIED_ORG: hypothetical protein J2X79_004499 [Arthrobacter globiformis]|nr:hypothetical protein [Arthrobacter globiformis]
MISPDTGTPAGKGFEGAPAGDGGRGRIAAGVKG